MTSANFHAMFIKVQNADGRPQFRCVRVWEGRDSLDYNPATAYSPAEYFVNVKRKPPVGKFCRRPSYYM